MRERHLSPLAVCCHIEYQIDATPQEADLENVYYPSTYPFNHPTILPSICSTLIPPSPARFHIPKSVSHLHPIFIFPAPLNPAPSQSQPQLLAPDPHLATLSLCSFTDARSVPDMAVDPTPAFHVVLYMLFFESMLFFAVVSYSYPRFAKH